jgi:hypothetical protein
MKTITTTIRKTLKARDIPASWRVELPDDPDATVTVTISAAEEPSGRRLVDFIGRGKGVYGDRAQADAHIRKLRQEWQA